jgi:hypothetical protein
MNTWTFWYRIGLAASATIAFCCLTAAVCTSWFNLSFGQGIWVGHRELSLYREGIDFRFGSWQPAPIFGSVSGTDEQIKQATSDMADGIGFDTKPHLKWLTLPSFDVSLWWGFASASLVPCFWLLQRRRRATVGFAVEAPVSRR